VSTNPLARSLVMLIGVVVALICCSAGQSENSGKCDNKSTARQDRYAPEYVKYDGGTFSVDMPKGWKIQTAGACSDLAFVIRDPQDGLRQIFYFGVAGPVYLHEQQKLLDYQYMAAGGYQIEWYEMPVVNPLTPENFLKNFHLIAQSNIAQRFMPNSPRLEDLQIISSQPAPCHIPGGNTCLIRAIFLERGKAGEGLFLVTAASMLPMNGNPGSGIGFGMMVTGITAPLAEFNQLQPLLLKSIESFSIEQSYIQSCMQQSDAAFGGILEAGKMLSETSDLLMQSWEKRNKSEDIIAAKRSDAMLGKERLYNPETGEVYMFQNGFYDKYNLHRNEYEMNGLEPLPENNYELWNRAVLDGEAHLR